MHQHLHELRYSGYLLASILFFYSLGVHGMKRELAAITEQDGAKRVCIGLERISSEETSVANQDLHAIIRWCRNPEAVTKEGIAQVIARMSECVSMGASVAARDHEGRNSLDLALEVRADYKIIYYLITYAQNTMDAQEVVAWINGESIANGKTPIMAAAENGRFLVVKNLLDMGADHDCIDKKTGDTLLHKLTRHEWSTYLLRELIGRGVEVNVRNHKGETAVDCALANKSYDAYEFLISQ